MPSRLGEPMERGERLVVGRGHVLGAARVAQERVLRPDARVVETGGDRVRVERSARRRRRAPTSARRGGRRPARAQARRTCGLDADEPHVLVVEEAGEEADRVRAAADAGDDRVREAVVRLEHLCRASRPMTACNSRTMLGYGAGPTQEPMR